MGPCYHELNNWLELKLLIIYFVPAFSSSPQFLLFSILLIVVQSPHHVWFFATPGLQHTKPPCPSPSPGVCPSSCPLYQWCHPAISFYDAFFFCAQPFPASGTFPMSQMFVSADQNTGASASSSVMMMNIQGWSPLRLTSLISLLSKELSGVFSSTTVQRHRFFGAPHLHYCPVFTTACDHWKTRALNIWTSVSRVLSLLFNTMSRFVRAFLPRSKHLLITRLQSTSTVTLEPKKRKSVTTSTFSPSICHEVIGSDAMILVFLIFSFKLALSLSFHSPPSPSPRGFLVPLLIKKISYFLYTYDIFFINIYLNPSLPKMELPHDPVISCLDIYIQRKQNPYSKTYVHPLHSQQYSLQ